jgi:RNA polymerase sigma-54 factor
MRLDQSQQLRLSQEMKLSPRMIQAMEILQLPMMALQERIEAEMESNPVLEMAETPSDEPAEPEVEYEADRGERELVVESDSGEADFERMDRMAAEYGEEVFDSDARSSGGSYDSSAPDPKRGAMENSAAPEESLNEYLHEQWNLMDVEEEIHKAGSLIIEHIDDDGYIRTDLQELIDLANRAVAASQRMQELAEETDDDEPLAEAADPSQQTATDGQTPDGPYTIDIFERALREVQTLEPTGVGARNLRECLLLQLAVKEAAGEDVALPKLLVSSYLREIEMNQLPQIAKRSGKDIEAIKQGLRELSHLNPHPGHLIGQRDVPTVEPDVYVDLDSNGNAVVTMSEANVPALVINEYYRQAARNRETDKATKQFLRKNIRSANWLITAIAQRRHTIRWVAEEVFKVQRDFLEEGREALKPLPMADIAEKVGVHVATVSRAVADKYALTPQGIVPLRMFFSGGTKTADGEEMSWDAVKVKLQEVIDNEDKSKPLSDEALAEALQAEGIDVARRTIAKYRNQMNIPSARKRRQY